MSTQGTLMSWDALHQANDTILELGEANIFRVLEQQLQAHNALLREVLSDFVDIVDDTYKGEFQQAVFGGDDVIYLDPIAELGYAEAEKTTVGQTVGFPLSAYARSVQWTRLAFEMMTGREFARQFDAIRKGNAIQVRNTILRAIFNPTNYSQVDRLTDGSTVNVKALTNADSGFLPPNPYGVEFDNSTHTHYLGTATLTEAGQEALLDTVVEHYISGQPVIYISKADEAAYRAFNKFTEYVPVNFIQAEDSLRARRQSPVADQLRVDNRAIGIFDQTAEVWVKPWMPASYQFCTILGQPKPVRMRQRRGGLYLATDNEMYPLRARMLQHEFGCGILERTNGACNYSANATYTAPTFTP